MLYLLKSAVLIMCGKNKLMLIIQPRLISSYRDGRVKVEALQISNVRSKKTETAGYLERTVRRILAAKLLEGDTFGSPAKRCKVDAKCIDHL